MDDDLERLLGSVPNLLEVVPIAKVMPGPNGSRLAFSFVEICDGAVRIHALQSGASIMDGTFLGMQATPEPGRYVEVDPAPRLARTWHLTDDVGTRYDDRPAHGGGTTMYSYIVIQFDTALPPEATRLHLTQGNGDIVTLDIDLQPRIPVTSTA